MVPLAYVVSHQFEVLFNQREYASSNEKWWGRVIEAKKIAKCPRKDFLEVIRNLSFKNIEERFQKSLRMHEVTKSFTIAFDIR